MTSDKDAATGGRQPASTKNGEEKKHRMVEERCSIFSNKGKQVPTMRRMTTCHLADRENQSWTIGEMLSWRAKMFSPIDADV